jgi:hypothetical protein
MHRVAQLIVRLACAAPAIRLSGEFADIGRSFGRTQESWELGGQGFDGDLTDHAVAGVAPGEGPGGQDHNGGEERWQ